MKSFVLSFYTTSDAIYAEKIFQSKGIAGRLIPVPRELSAGCGMAWASDVSLKEKCIEALLAGQIEPEDTAEISL